MESIQAYEQIRDLKERWGIGTSQAYRDLKSKNQYGILKKKVEERLEQQGNPRDIPLREIMNLTEYLTACVNQALDAQASCNALRLHTSRIEYHVLTPYDDECFEDLVNVEFDIDNTVLTYYSQTNRNLETRIRKTIREFIKGPHPYLTMPDGQAITFKEFKEKNRIETANPQYSWRIPVEKKAMKYDIREFREWYHGNHPVTFNPNLLSLVEQENLLGWHKESQYARARRDQTLRQLWPSRRIALNYILPSRELGEPELIYAQGIRNAQWQIQQRTERITRLFEIDSPRVILQLEIDLIEEKKYILWALRTHKKWVKEALGELLSEQ
ncbi:MAG: hypothetical protein ABIJ21_06970 [Nanoarchaeota archaeon]